MSNIFWAHQDYKRPGWTVINFTEAGIKSLGQIWNIIPKFKIGQHVIKGDSLFTCEVTSGLRNIRSSFSGIIVEDNFKVYSHPEIITKYTPLLFVSHYEM
jgi:glycine cleavage system H lipoate-binding protein